MNENIIELKVKRIWSYVLFLFAFIFCGIVFGTLNIGAAPVISIPTDSYYTYDNTITFHVGYDVLTVKEVKYNLGGSWYTISSPESSYTAIYKDSSADSFCSGKSYISTCTNVILSYKISDISSKGLSISSDGKFTIKVEASNQTLFVGGGASASRTLIYDGTAPGVSKVELVRNDSSTAKTLIIGKTLKFNVYLTEASYISSGAKVSFKIGGTSKTAICGTSTSKLVSSFSCTYTIVSGDSGDISSVSMTGANNVKDKYGNAMSSSVSGFTFSNSNSYTVDGVKPTISKIESINGIYSSASNIQVQVTFTENLSAGSGYSAPVMKVKFGEGSEQRCRFDSAVEKSMLYTCTPSSTDQGALVFVSLTEGSGITDTAGNAISLSFSSKTFSGVTVDNNIPTLTSVTVTPKSCKTSGSNYYCNSEKKINVSFKFNMGVTINSKTITIKFGGTNAKNTYTSSYDSTKNTLDVVYTVNAQDNGEMTIDYNFSLTGANALTNNITNKKSDCKVYVDNQAPSVGTVEAFVGTDSVGTTVYGNPGVVVTYKINVNENSVLTLDASKVSLVDEYDNKITANSKATSGITKIEVSLNGKVVVVSVTFAGAAENKFKIKIEKAGLKDSFDATLANDYFSSLYTVDTRAPEFNVEVVYPANKGYNNGSKWILISGDAIEYKITSSNVDLKDYCILTDTSKECEEYFDLELDTNYTYTFNKKGNGDYSFYVRVRDDALNVTDKLVGFEFKEMFTYSNGEGAIAKEHSIVVDVSMFATGSVLKYDWYKKGTSLSFTNANSTSKQDDTITLEGDPSFNGEYRVCINNVSTNDTLCSAYVTFDTKIDEFNVAVSSGWVNTDLPTTITFKDSSTIKCIAVGKNESNLNCEKAVNSNVIIYRTSQAINPLKKYVISENGIYYFYIEDAVGNKQTITKEVTNIDKTPIDIKVFNGQVGTNNTNLEVDSYKSAHTLLVTFDKDVAVGSAHGMYKYFFANSSYTNINSKDVFNAYYLNSVNRQEVTNCNKTLTITTPNFDGVHHLYIMAIDLAGNVSFKVINDIMVDSSGPTIKLYDSQNNEVNGGSASYIAVFDYTIVIEDKDSKLNLNKISYKWINSSSATVVEKTYDGCGYDYNTCKILGSDIEFGEGLFNPAEKYKFVITAYDNAGNSSTFISNDFMIDTMAPTIVIDIDENAWYENGNVSFAVSKENNGTLSSIAYCLNDCLTNGNPDLTKFKLLSVSNSKRVEKTVDLVLTDGENILYVYASDVFGNYTYKTATIKYDSENTEITVNGLNEDNVVDLTGKEDLEITVVIKDQISGIQTYCVYYNNDTANKVCFDGNGLKEISRTLGVEKNGVYSIEANDVSGNKVIYNVSVIGIDTEPIEFDLTSNVKVGQFVKGNVTISVVNMRKFMVENVNDRILTIEYVKVAYDAVVANNERVLFGENPIISVYNKNTSSSLVTSFVVTENMTYIVKIVDTARNVSYNYIRISCIDNDNPFINTNKYPDNSDRIYVHTASGNNLRIFVKEDGVSKVYKYSNDVIKVFFGNDSLKDVSTGYNGYLGLKVCFETTDCVYNTYNVSTSVSGGYVINGAISVAAPYNFSGIIRYYVVDGAGNESARGSFEVEYQSEISEVSVNLEDANGNAIVDTNKYAKVVVNLSGDEINDIITNGGIRYALVASNVNLHNELINNKGTIGSFLSNYGFVVANNKDFEVSKNYTDNTYYLWVYVSDLLNNSKLIKAATMIRLDTIAPSFSDVNLSINKLDSTNYDLSIDSVVEGYTLYVDSDNNGVYETINFVNNKATFTVSGLDSVNFKLIDSAGNSTVQLYSLNVASKVYAKVYQVGNTREANIVIYNLGSKNVTSFRYIITNVNSGLVYDNNTINDDTITVCNGYEDTCRGTINSAVEKGIYNLNINAFNKDKKVIFYIYVDGTLIDLVEKNIVVDNTAPEVTFEQGNPNVISTVNGNNYEFKVVVEEDNLTSLADKKYIITTNSNVSNFTSIYESCTNSNTCARGLYSLSSDLKGTIEINSNSSKFSGLFTGTYYLYVYVQDDFGNSKVVKSSAIYIDNENPIIQYSLKNASNVFFNINEEVYVGGAAKVKLLDNYRVSYFEVYKAGTLTSVCYIDDASKDTNCIRNNSGEIGLSIENGVAYYYLDNGSYSINLYDTANNVRRVSINIDASAPVIGLYKEVSGVYEEQLSGKKLYSDLSNLYVTVTDETFNYLTIDLYNTITGDVVTTASRYSYNSEIGECLTDRGECAHGVALTELLLGNTIQYNKIIIRAYDKANRSSSVEISYDDLVPQIWTLDVGESIYIGGTLYTIETGRTISIEIGVNEKLTMDTLLNKIVLDVDGMSYYQAKEREMFKVMVYQNGTLFTKDFCKYIGNYTVELSYVDEAGNAADVKQIKVNVNDNTNPNIIIQDDFSIAEIKEEVVVNGALAKDNYGLEMNLDTIIKEKTLLLSNAVCSALIEGVTETCDSNVVKVSDTIYKFMTAGKYSFTYTITDLAGNSTTVTQVINALDSAGPQMSSSVDGKTTFNLYFGNRVGGAVNINNIVLSYPNSFDKGDNENKAVVYDGLYGLNNMNEKYKLSDIYKVSDINNSITYSFKKTGTYYLRFTSVDSNDNISIFEYEVKVIDNIAPIISGVVDNEIIKLGLEEDFSVEYILNKYGITASDNYDSNVKIYYELRKSNNHSHEILLKASDSSNNSVNVILHVDIEDYVAPNVGDLMLDVSTNKNELEFVVLGGSDNSNNWWHEYSVQGGAWIRVDENSKLQFGQGLSQTVEVCVRAIDGAGNISLAQSCKNILVDTKAPTFDGINDGDVVANEITVNVSDDRLDSVEVWFNNELLQIGKGNLPFKFSEVGAYQIVAKDTIGNVAVASFIINIDSHMNVVNDINAEEYTINSIEFDKRFLVRVDISYDANGYSNIYARLDNISINANDMLYILGVIPNSDAAFVIFSVNGSNIANYANGVNLIGNGSNFKEGINNEECFVRFNDYYYAYVLVKENAYTEPVGVADDNSKNRDDSKLLSGLIIGLGSVVVVLIGYQIIKFRKRVRAA